MLVSYRFFQAVLLCLFQVSGFYFILCAVSNLLQLLKLQYQINFQVNLQTGLLNTLQDMNEVTRDEEEVKKMTNDGLRYLGGMKAKLGKALLSAMDMVDASKMKTPTLIVLGEKDKICYPKGTKAFFEALGLQDKEYKEYPDARHNLLMELADTKTAMFEDVKRWLGGRIGGKN